MAKGKGKANNVEGSSENGEKSSENEFITLAVARELLLVQERTYKSFTDSLTRRVDDLVNIVADLKASLEFSNKEIDEHKTKLSFIEGNMLAIQSSIGILETNATKLLKKSTDLENRRRKNIRIDGIHEDTVFLGV